MRLGDDHRSRFDRTRYRRRWVVTLNWQRLPGQLRQRGRSVIQQIVGQRVKRCW